MLMSSPWDVPFLSRTPSGAISITGRSNVTISGKQFVNIGNDVSSIRITRCSGVLITACDFDTDCQPITIDTCTNVEISWCRYHNITGPHARTGANRANFTQWISTQRGWIHNNKGIGGDTEDIISMFASGGGDTAHPLTIENNSFEGTNWSSSSGSGIMLGDNGGAHIIARNNTLLNPGAVGIGIASGTDIHVTGNTIYGQQRSSSNVGIYVWNQYPSTCGNNEVSGNKVKWFKADGAQNPGWNGENCGPVAGWANNDWYSNIDPVALHVTL
jgi:hypothetical protein